jgi:hypothetical protein
MYHSRSLTKEDMFDELNRAHQQGLIKTLTLSSGLLIIEISPHLHYSKTYDLFEYLRLRYSNAQNHISSIFVGGIRTIMVFF